MGPAHDYRDLRRVSILARPEGRALRVIASAIAVEIRFQSSPVPKDGRYGTLSKPLIG